MKSARNKSERNEGFWKIFDIFIVCSAGHRTLMTRRWKLRGEGRERTRRSRVERLFNLNCFALALERWRNKSQQLQLCSMRFRFRYPTTSMPTFPLFFLTFSPRFPQFSPRFLNRFPPISYNSLAQPKFGIVVFGCCLWQSLSFVFPRFPPSFHLSPLSPSPPRKTAKHFRSSSGPLAPPL